MIYLLPISNSQVIKFPPSYTLQKPESLRTFMTEKSKPQHRQRQLQSRPTPVASFQNPVTSFPVLPHVIHAPEGLTTFRTFDGAMIDMLYSDMPHQGWTGAKCCVACAALPAAFPTAVRTKVKARLSTMRWEEWEIHTYARPWSSLWTKVASTCATWMLGFRIVVWPGRRVEEDCMLLRDKFSTTGWPVAVCTV